MQAEASLIVLISMVRDPVAHPNNHLAQVHPQEVENYRAAGWKEGHFAVASFDQMGRSELIERALDMARDQINAATDEELRAMLIYSQDRASAPVEQAFAAEGSAVPGSEASGSDIPEQAEATGDPSAPVEIPEGWQALQWKQRVKLAKAITGTAEELSADAADQLIDLEVRRRRQDETAGDPPLTRREIEADLYGMGQDFNPAAPLTDLRSLRDVAHAALKA
jgi:hypothetical protein